MSVSSDESDTRIPHGTCASVIHRNKNYHAIHNDCSFLDPDLSFASYPLRVENGESEVNTEVIQLHSITSLLLSKINHEVTVLLDDTVSLLERVYIDQYGRIAHAKLVNKLPKISLSDDLCFAYKLAKEQVRERETKIFRRTIARYNALVEQLVDEALADTYLLNAWMPSCGTIAIINDLCRYIIKTYRILHDDTVEGSDSDTTDSDDDTTDDTNEKKDIVEDVYHNGDTTAEEDEEEDDSSESEAEESSDDETTEETPDDEEIVVEPSPPTGCGLAMW